jgi:hypothetical protein
MFAVVVVLLNALSFASLAYVGGNVAYVPSSPGGARNAPGGRWMVRRRLGLRWAQAENDALAWLRSAAAARNRARLAYA